MNVGETLLIGELQKGKLIAGHSGLHRKVNFVEVLEVPEVSSWITPGVLMMTTFYSTKDEPEMQIKVISDLIEKNAAGIVIKLGRFIEKLPKKVLELANEHDFPIISIPKDVSYIKILNPLYEKLFLEKQKKEQFLLNPLLEILDSESHSIEEVLNKMKDSLNLPIYIEDLEGRLLYASEDFMPDGWRKQVTIFSKPDYVDYKKIMYSWLKDFTENGYATMKIPGFRNRLLLPLTSQSQPFAILHMPHWNDIAMDYSNALKELSNRFSKLFMSNQLYQQRIRLNDMEVLENILKQVEMEDTKAVCIVHFSLPALTEQIYNTIYLIDYTSIIRKKLYNFVNQLSDSFTFTIFEKDNQFYALGYGEEADYPTMIAQWSKLLQAQNKPDENEIYRVAISPTIKSEKEIEDALHTVKKTLEIGTKIKPDEWVYTFEQLGIYEILFNLTSDEFTRSYANNLLAPLLDNQGELLKTLEVYLNENGNNSRSAEILFIHRRTLTNRIQKIEQLLNMNLEDSMNRFILRFCLLIKDLT